LLYYLYNDREEKKLLDSIIIHKISIDALFIYEQTKYIEIYVCNKDGNKYSINPIMLDINKNSYYDAYSIWNDKLYEITQHITQTSLFSSINIDLDGYYICLQDFIINFNGHYNSQIIVEYSTDETKSFKKLGKYSIDKYFKIVIPKETLAAEVGFTIPFSLRLKDEHNNILHLFNIIPMLLNYYPVDDEQLYVSDSHLHTSFGSNDMLSVNSYFEQVGNKTFQGKDLNKDVYLQYNFKGPYRLTFSRKNYCPAERYVFVPEVKYNKVNESDNEFWYENEKRNAVTLEYKYPQDSTEELIFNHNTNINSKITSTKSNDGKIVVSGHIDNSDPDTLDCNVSIFDFETDKNLNKIDVTITSDKNKQFVPVHINL